MKIEVNEDPKKEPRPYPKLMIAKDGEIVLMNEPCSGMVVNGKCNRMGDYSGSWAMELFADFHGTITLQND